MLDPLSAYAACKSGIALIEQGVKTGKKLVDLSSSISKWVNGESSLDLHASNKGKGGILSKLGLSSVEEDAMAAYLRKKEIRDQKERLREIFLLYADNGLQEWENLQSEIATMRKRKKEQLRRQIEEREQIKKTIGVVIFVLLIASLVVIYGKIFKWF